MNFCVCAYFFQSNLILIAASEERPKVGLVSSVFPLANTIIGGIFHFFVFDLHSWNAFTSVRVCKQWNVIWSISTTNSSRVMPIQCTLIDYYCVSETTVIINGQKIVERKLLQRSCSCSFWKVGKTRC